MAESAQQLLQYDALNETNDEIRLFWMDIETSNDYRITGRLETVQLKDCLDFRALSYEWGSEDDPRLLQINGQYLSVRANLFEFLTSYRAIMTSEEERVRVRRAESPWVIRIDPRTHLPFWIDQICINQQNFLERNHQVALMGRIYSQANQVLAWLGASCAAAMQFMDSPGFYDHTRVRRGDSMKKRRGRHIDPPRSWVQQVQPFVQGSYWERLWVQQEIVLARKVVFVAGTTWIEADLLSPLIKGQSVRQHWALKQAIERAQHERTAERDRTSAPDAGASVSLIHAINTFSAKQCVEVRDKVYGLQGMVEGDERISVDYSLPVVDVFALVVSTLVRKHYGHPFSTSDPKEQMRSDSVELASEISSRTEQILTYCEQLPACVLHLGRHMVLPLQQVLWICEF